MRKLIIVLILFALIIPSMALTEYQQGVLDGLSRGWFMASKYDQAKAGDPAAYNEAVSKYNEWIVSVFGQNESLMMKPFDQTSQATPYFDQATQATPYFVQRTIQPVHSIDSSWNQTSLLPEPDASGRIQGVPAETYYSIGPALINF